MENKYCMIEIAFDSKEEVSKVVDVLLNNKLVASCQVVESDSKWNWKGNVEGNKEYLLLCKTKRSLFSEIFDEVKKIHSYDVFEFAIFDLNSVNSEYLKWIDENTK